MQAQTGTLNGITSMDDGIVLAKSHQNSIAEDGVKGRCDAEQDGSIWSSFAPRLVQRMSLVAVDEFDLQL